MQYLADLHVLDTKSMTWSTPETTGEKPSPRAWHTANVIGKYIVVFGGTAGRLSFYNDVYVLDTEKMHWFKVDVQGEQPAPRCSHTSTWNGSKLIVFGGITSLSATVDRKITPLGDLFVLETGLSGELSGNN
jgi:Rab9 effector protein with kelch motifs